MDKERIAGGVKKATGTVKKAVGKATGDRRLEAEGRADKAEGRVRSAVGHLTISDKKRDDGHAPSASYRSDPASARCAAAVALQRRLGLLSLGRIGRAGGDPSRRLVDGVTLTLSGVADRRR
jgi:uncharacterized protein YjbJ (UPF0337 family)